MNSTEVNGSHFALLSLSWIDYALFTIMFGLSAIIGFYYGCFGNKQATTKDYLYGGKTMNIFPVGMSLMASNLSGISLMGIPSEIYMFGTQYSMCMLSVILMAMIVSNIYLPVFYRLQLNSTYEYLKLRFSNRIRMMASTMYVIFSFLYIPLVIYVPAIALNQVTGMDLHLITPIVSFICIFYTALGGLKSVVFTDTLQFSITLLTLGFVLIKGTMSVGGFATIWEISKTGGRLEFFNMDLDPTVRITFWNVVISHIFAWMSQIGCQPACVQRFMAVPTLGKAKKSLILLAVGMIVTKAICSFTGLIIYAKYQDCDPYTAGLIKRPDQILAYYVLDVASEIPGISGLFVAGVFTTALSTLSTFLNSLAGIIYTDFIAGFMPLDTSEEKSSNIMKAIVVIMGGLCVCLVFIVEKLGSVLEMSVSFFSVTAGPLLGLFTLGMVFPNANEKGAFWGGISALVITGLIVLQTQLHNYRGIVKYLPKSLNVYGCDSRLNSTFMWLTPTTESPIPHAEDEVSWFFKISFYYFVVIGTILTIVIGLLVSLVTRDKNAPDVDPSLLSPIINKFWRGTKKSADVRYTSVEQHLQKIDLKEEDLNLNIQQKDREYEK